MWWLELTQWANALDDGDARLGPLRIRSWVRRPFHRQAFLFAEEVNDAASLGFAVKIIALFTPYPHKCLHSFHRQQTVDPHIGLPQTG